MSSPLLSPWTKEETAPRVPGLKSIHDREVEDQTFRFAGRTRAVYVTVPEGEDAEDRASDALGQAVLDLTKQSALLTGFLRDQGLSFAPPLVPHVPLSLGSVELFAAISTTDLDEARRMAVDRLVYALTAIKARSERAKELLRTRQINLVNM